MNINKFAKKLEQYISNTIYYEIINDSVIRVFVDNEIYYDFDWNQMKLSMYEKNIKKEIDGLNSKKESRVNFAILMRHTLQDDTVDPIPVELDKCDDLDALKFIMRNYVDRKYCSVGTIETGKLSIIFDDNYEILYKTNTQKYCIDKASDKKYIFSRFYYEVTYYASFMKDLKDYQVIFNETFSEEEIGNILDYHF